jgi:prepilin-type N-terminal cleavage/methylation domain-containing protein/prepilin-type processing-associated H-X9-DG protein
MILASCRKRHTGFTLIELLVVIAIIGILAAMLFPVFARARESARKTQCLANVKNIAMSIQIYLTDYDATPPDMVDSEAMTFFLTGPGHGGGQDRDSCFRAFWANPFLRQPVVYDDYVKSREVWKCPSAKLQVTFASPFFIVPNYDGVWWKYLQNHMGEWGTGKVCSPCGFAYPPGWGGTTTDSIAQQKMASSSNYVWITGAGTSSGSSCFDPGIGCYEGTHMTTSAMNDPSALVLCGDLGVFPTLNSNDRNLFAVCDTCGNADWANCSWTRTCGISGDEAANSFANDPTYRAKYTKHMGGSNFGFADGHAKWIPAETFRATAEHCVCCSPETGGTGSTTHLVGEPGTTIDTPCF